MRNEPSKALLCAGLLFSTGTWGCGAQVLESGEKSGFGPAGLAAQLL